MALDQLLEALEQENRRRIAACREQAADEARRLRAEARASARQQLRRSLESHRGALGVDLARALDAARMAAARSVLAAGEAMRQRVRAAALEAVPEVARGPEYAAALPRLMELALEGMRGDLVVRSAPAIAERVRALLAESPRRVEGARVIADAELESGFVVEARGGEVRVEATLEALLDEAWPTLAVELQRRSEGEP